MKILVFGANGQLGRSLEKNIKKNNLLKNQYKWIWISRQNCDFQNIFTIKKIIKMFKPKIVINAAAFTNVDGAELKKYYAYKINALAPKVIAEEVNKLGSLLIHLSTDFVFDGTRKSPYRENQKANPISSYGYSKLKGENFVRMKCSKYLIIRTSWLFGDGQNFIKKMLELFRKEKALSIVEDQIGVPTSTNWLAKIICSPQILEWSKKESILNIVPNGYINRYELAVHIYEKAKELKLPLICEKITAIKSIDYKSPAKRPLNSILDNTKLKKIFKKNTIISWKELVDNFIISENRN